MFVHDEVQLEAVEPAHGAFTFGCQPLEDFVSPYSAIVADD
jgi:hypothetical protein